MNKQIDYEKLLAAPCVFCGYNGPNYWQPNVHPEHCVFAKIGSASMREDLIKMKLHDLMFSMPEEAYKRGAVALVGSEVKRTSKACVAAEALNPFHEAILANCRDLGPFLVQKNEAYGDSARRVSRMLEVFFPDGIKPNRIEDAYYMIQILNKLGRVAEDNDPMGEDPWLDASGYAMLAHSSKQLKKENKK